MLVAPLAMTPISRFQTGEGQTDSLGMLWVLSTSTYAKETTEGTTGLWQAKALPQAFLRVSISRKRTVTGATYVWK